MPSERLNVVNVIKKVKCHQYHQKNIKCHQCKKCHRKRLNVKNPIWKVECCQCHYRICQINVSGMLRMAVVWIHHLFPLSNIEASALSSSVCQYKLSSSVTETASKHLTVSSSVASFNFIFIVNGNLRAYDIINGTWEQREITERASLNFLSLVRARAYSEEIKFD